MDNCRFEIAKEKVIGIDRQRLGIGTLSEKTVHAILKNYYEPDEDHQEIPIDRYVADIYRDEKIIEIQTRQFDRMRDKLKAFLSLYEVTIVHPLPNNRWLIWIDEKTGETTKKRKTPTKPNPYLIFPELYKIKMYLKDPNLRIRIAFLDMEEYRLLNGWSKDKKKGSTRYDRIPVQLVSEMDITCLQDYMMFVPETIDGEFTVKEFAKEAKITNNLARTAINILYHVGVITRVGKKGNAFVYTIIE